MREFRGERLFDPVKDYVVVDIETTGFDPYKDDIIEIAALRVRNYSVIESFSTLVKAKKWISPFIENLTGISNEMLTNSPKIDDVVNDVYNFINNDPIIGHNVCFDINFLYDRCIQYIGKPLTNNYLDTMRLAKLLLKGLPNYRLSTISDFFKCSDNKAHRALNDCYTTNECYLHLIEQNRNSTVPMVSFVKAGYLNSRASNIIASTSSFDETHPLFGRVCVFTGSLQISRKDAMQKVVDLGGLCSDSVTSKTNFLILGNNEYCPTIKDGKSTKQKKAEDLRLKGCDIEVISENVFYDLLSIERY